MRSTSLDIDPANVDPDGLADGNSSAGATVDIDGDLTSGGTFTSADGLAHRLDIIDVGADVQTTATYTITGTDADGRVQAEDIAGPGSGATIETTKYFLTVVSIAIATPVAGSTVDIGTVDEIASKTIVIDWYKDTAPLVSVDVTGTISIDVELTNNNPLEVGHTGDIPAALQTVDQNSYLWVNDDSLAAITVDTHAQISDYPLKAIRIVTNSYTDTAEAQVIITSSTK